MTPISETRANLNALPIKHIHDRWIGQYAEQAVEILSQLQSNLEDQVS